MTIISNTSPLTNLAAIGQFDLLQTLYIQIHIAQGVWEELQRAIIALVVIRLQPQSGFNVIPFKIKR